MTSLLDDAFAHHVWATLRVLDMCAELTDERLATNVPGTYGSILDTLRHIVEADAWYLTVMTSGQRPAIDESTMGIAELRDEMVRNGPAWSSLLAGEIDPDAVIVRRHDDGSETHATWGIRLAQAVHHGTDHRSQICTALTSLGIDAPLIDVWDHGATNGRVLEVPPTT